MNQENRIKGIDAVKGTAAIVIFLNYKFVEEVGTNIFTLYL